MRAPGRRIGVRPRLHLRLPKVARITRTTPPNADARARRHVIRRQFSVLGLVPLARELRVYGTQAVVASYAVPRTKRAGPMAHLPRGGSLPFVTARALPP